MFYFLKLGGSLITDKAQPHFPRKAVIRRIAAELRSALEQIPETRILIGHGSGSFGHVPAKIFNTRLGVSTRDEWLGFAKVWYEASTLNKIIIDIFEKEKLPVVSFQPSSMIVTNHQKIKKWDLTPLESALNSRLIPVIYGDVIFDLSQGGTILSTEELFFHLAMHFKPEKILLAGREEGVYKGFPEKNQIIPRIDIKSFSSIQTMVGGSSSTDVTGGMLSKVETMLALTKKIPTLEIYIFSGNKPENIKNALMGKKTGTLIHNS